MQVRQKTFLVSGGSSGLGEACARRFHDLGARVVLMDVNAERGEQVAAELEHGVFAATDVTDPASVEAALQLALSNWGAVHGAINCAGIIGASRVLQREGAHDLELFTRVIQVNLVGTFNVCRLTAAAMQHNEPDDNGERGVLINTASVAAFEGQIGQAAYAASKGGVASLSLPMARELSRHGIRVMAIAPGIFLTPMIESVPDAVRESLEAQTVFPTRLGTPDEYAHMAQHIVENPMLNGSVIRLDGAVRMTAK